MSPVVARRFAVFFLVTAGFSADLAPIAVDYPLAGSLFPPDFAAPTFLWTDTTSHSVAWSVEVKLEGRRKPLRLAVTGDPYAVGPLDERTVAPTNERPVPTPEQQRMRTWKPDDQTWAAIRKHSVGRPATITITGFSDARGRNAVSRGEVRISTSTDPVAAPIFYRDVPLMPTDEEKGIIKPLAKTAVPLIAWRLRDVSKPESRLLMTGVHTCANCHSFSRDGKTMGMDMDGPHNDKGLYALVAVQKQMTIRNEDMIAWSTHRGKLGGRLRVGFMSQVSPDGRHVVTTINDPGPEDPKRMGDLINNYYVTNFRDYRFLQVFYPTRGILAWYSRETGRLQPLPGADDPRYVHTNATWSPDGKYLVFARADARDSYGPGSQQAEYANDPREHQIQYDLYRIPFNDGQGGVAEPIAGASANGMSNSFPKISPDGRWLVFVKARNGLLMRPDSELWIVPVEGGTARRMAANTARMNSWHSFSPNGRWLVFSSKSRSPYTQMFLTHIDEDGQDSPAILVENSTAANRAVNIPEFVNIAPDGLDRIDAPAADFYRLAEAAAEAREKGELRTEIETWRKALELSPADSRALYLAGAALARDGQLREALDYLRRSTAKDPRNAEAWIELGLALTRERDVTGATDAFRTAVEADPDNALALSNLGNALVQNGRIGEALDPLRRSAALQLDKAEPHNNLGIALVRAKRLDEAIEEFTAAARLAPESRPIQYNLGKALADAGRYTEAIAPLQASAAEVPEILDLLAAVYAEAGRFEEAVRTASTASAAAERAGKSGLAAAIARRLALYQSGRTYLSGAR